MFACFALLALQLLLTPSISGLLNTLEGSCMHADQDGTKCEVFLFQNDSLISAKPGCSTDTQLLCPSMTTPNNAYLEAMV